MDDGDRARSRSRRVGRARRRPDRRRRHLRHRRRLPPRRERFPGKTFVVLDALDSRGGTWWTHRYPGVRSDSDLFTFGYRFKPWRGPLDRHARRRSSHYLGEVIDENDLGRHIRYRHRVLAASWSTDDRRWTVEVTRERHRRAPALHDRLPLDVPGLLPPRPGLHARVARASSSSRARSSTRRSGPRTSTCAGKRVVVIGSGATAATLIPAIADDRGARDDAAAVADVLLRPAARPTSSPTRCAQLDVPDEWTHEILRRAYIAEGDEITRMSFESPDELRALLLDVDARRCCPRASTSTSTSTPRYRPWQQRIAVVPGRRPVHRDARGQGVGRHRHDRVVHRDGHPAGLRRRARRPTSSSPPPAST